MEQAATNILEELKVRVAEFKSEDKLLRPSVSQRELILMWR